MYLKDHGLVHKKAGEVIETVSSRNLEIALLAFYDGTEIIHHSLLKNSKWAIGPDEGWDALEFIYILSGELVLNLDKSNLSIKKGDYLKAIPIKKDCFFTAKVDTEFLYVTSQPVFHHYSHTIQKFRNLAIEVEQKDGYTAEHCNRIMKLSLLVADVMQLSAKELYQLNLGSFLHDIGKIKVPDHVLNKPGKLTDSEWAIMKSHPIYGKIIMEETKFPSLVEAAPIVEQHHERYDGKGYPYGLQKNEILIGASIVSVVDSYDAMTTDRVYRKALSIEEAFSEIQEGKESQFHPDVVDAFFSIEQKILEKE